MQKLILDMKKRVNNYFLHFHIVLHKTRYNLDILETLYILIYN